MASDSSLVVYIQTLWSLAFVLGGLRSFLQAFMAKAEHALALEVCISASQGTKEGSLPNMVAFFIFLFVIFLIQKNGFNRNFSLGTFW